MKKKQYKLAIPTIAGSEQSSFLLVQVKHTVEAKALRIVTMYLDAMVTEISIF